VAAVRAHFLRSFSPRYRRTYPNAIENSRSKWPDKTCHLRRPKRGEQSQSPQNAPLPPRIDHNRPGSPREDQNVKEECLAQKPLSTVGYVRQNERHNQYKRRDEDHTKPTPLLPSPRCDKRRKPDTR